MDVAHERHFAMAAFLGFGNERARQLLARTTLSIKEIAAQTGFASPFYFSLRFKAASGSSPRDYRRRAEAGRKAHTAST